MTKQEILLEAGTNEVEIVEFSIGNNGFAVNALKIKQFIVLDESQINPIPDSAEGVVGSILYQDEAVSVVDLKTILKVPDGANESNDRKVLLFCEFNSRITAYIVDNVYKIQRISWEDIKPLGAEGGAQGAAKSVGVVVIEDRQITMLDFEKINALLFSNELEEINARIADNSLRVEKKQAREDVRILYAEDSQVYLKAIPEYFARHGYNRLTSFENGYDLYEHFKKLASDEKPDVVLTDIEMPRMDGLTLCKRLKEISPQVKVVVVSSLVSDQMNLKCETVGADDFLVKKDVARLIEKLDQLFIKNE